MGASEFITHATGATPEEAFRRAVEQAQYERGHGGYTGTIAEKDRAVMAMSAVYPDAETAGAHAATFLRRDERAFTDKWGPAGYIEYRSPVTCPAGERAFVFFGVASS